MRRIFFIFTLILIFSCSQSYADENYITVYNKELGLIKQVRKVRMDVDNKKVIFTDVAARLIPTSVHLRFPEKEKEIRVIEQNFEYDLVSSEKILQKYIDHPIDIILEQGGLIKGILLSRQGRSLVLKTEDGLRIIPWNDQMSIAVKELPEGLITRPTLIWDIAGEVTGDTLLEVSYLTQGMDWHAEYVGVINREGTMIDMEAWVSIENNSGASFNDSSLKLVAGDVNRVQEEGARELLAKGSDRIMMQESAPQFEEREFFEYHIYELERKTDLKNNQNKQIALFQPVRIKCEKRFFFNANTSPGKVDVKILFRNKKESGMGKPLPEGIFRLFQRDGEAMEFVGEDRIDHTGLNEEVRISLGKAFDLAGEKRITSRQNLSKRSQRSTVEIELRNNKKNEDVVITVEEPMTCSDWTIEESSFPFIKKDVRNVEFDIPVQAGKKAVLHYTVLCNW